MNSFKFLNFIKKGDKSYFDVTASEQKQFLDTLELPKDDFDRSYKQYLCQRFFSTKTKGFIFNIGSIILLPILLIYYHLKGLKKCRECHIDAVGEFSGMTEIIPESLKSEFEINNEVWFEGAELRMLDIKFILKFVCRYFYAPYFLVKAIAKIARYSYTISHRTPRAIIVHDEYSYTSSLLTNYCDFRHVEHIDVMHGEKLFYIGNSHFRYNRTYIWGEHYKQLFYDLRANQEQFVIEIPKCFQINCTEAFRQEYFADYKYYLQVFNEEQLLSIISSMDFANKKGLVIKYRPHPRFSDITLLEKHVPSEFIEYPKEVPIVNSIASAKYSVGSYSTVLNQAYYSGKDVIFDDVTYHEEYNKLKELRYIFSSMDDKRLSTISK